MPQKCQPDRLERLSLKAVGEWIKVVGRDLMDPMYTAMQHDPNQGQLLLHNLVGLVRNTLFSTTPWYLYDQMAQQVLMVIKKLVNEIKFSDVFLNKKKVVGCLTEVVMHSKLKSLEMYRWPKEMMDVLYENMHRLKGVESLNLHSGTSNWDITITEKYIPSGVTVMSNLTKFCLMEECTNNILLALGKNCPALQCVDVSYSDAVTDRAISYLLNCKKLKEVMLCETKVTISGYKDLLSGLPNLQDIGICNVFGNVLQKLHEDKCKPLSLLSLEIGWRDLTLKQQQLLAMYCPKLSSLSIICNLGPDVTFLSSLQNLEDLELMSCNFYSHRVRDLFEKVGMNLISIRFHQVKHIDLNGLKYISQLCPNLKKLGFIGCEFSDHCSMRYISPNDHIAQFACLERLVCDSYCSLEQLEFLLMQCHNIKFIQLGSSTGINDSTIRRVLEKNPLSKLEELHIPYSPDLSMESVELLMDCEQLHTLSELEDWEGITDEELTSFKEYLRENNLKLAVSVD